MNKSDKKKIITYGIIMLIGTVLFVLWYINNNKPDMVINYDDHAMANGNEETEKPVANFDDDETSSAESELTVDENTPIKTYISGEVKNPGVYEMEIGDRIIDLLVIAGGFTEDADENIVNMAEKIEDEQHIVIPKIGEYIDKNDFNVQNNNSDDISDAYSLININDCDKEDLETLPGIGTVIAEAIIEYRDKNGKFEDIEELKNVYKIGDKTFDRIKDRITLD